MTNKRVPENLPSDSVRLTRLLQALDHAEHLLQQEDFNPDVLLVNTPGRLIAFLREVVG